MAFEVESGANEGFQDVATSRIPQAIKRRTTTIRLLSLVDKNGIRIELNTEAVRFVAYLCFLLQFGIGILLTYAFGSVDFDDNGIINTFGYNAVCLFWDYPPAKTYMNFFWGITLTASMIYKIIRVAEIMISQAVDDNFTKKTANILLIMSAFEILTILFFGNTFTTSPDENIVSHTLPFTIFMVGLWSMGLSNVIFGVNHYYRGLNLHSRYVIALIAYLVIYFIVVITKVMIQLNKLFPESLGYCLECDYLLSLGRVLDGVWFILAFVIPLIASGYQAYNHDNFPVLLMDLTHEDQEQDLME